MNKDMLVEIYVSFKNKQGEIATGYPVAPNRILTARHVLYPDCGEQPEKIEIRWHYLKDKPEYDWRDAEIIECELNPELDVVLLGCNFPEDIDCCCQLEDKNPGEEVSWESEGFARAGKRDDKRPPTQLGGDAYSAANNAEWLSLTEKAKTEVPEMWKGISGAPVFKKNSNLIMGVIVECPPNFDAGRLAATPAWKLLECEGFCNQVLKSKEGIEILRDWFKPLFLQKLGQSEFLEKTALEVFRTLNPDSNVFNVAKLADMLIDSAPAQRTAFMQELYSSAVENRGSAENETLHKLAILMMCLVFPDHTAASVITESRNKGESIIEGITADKMDTEAALAKAHKVAPNIKYRRGQPSYPYNVSPNEKRCGLSDHHKQAVKDISEQLEMKLAPGDSCEVVNGMWVEVYKKGGAGNMVASLEKNEDKLRALARRSSKKPRPFYVTLAAETKDSELDRWRVLTKEFENLDLVKLKKNSDPETVDLFSDLEDIILNTESDQSDDN